MTELEVYISSYFGMNPTELQKLAALFEPASLKKEEFFAQTGKHCPQLSFVKSGFLRVYEYANGKDITQWITSQGEFAADLAGLVFQQGARRNIQALTDCELYTISGENYRNIHQVIPQWPELEKRFLSKCFMTLEDRIFSFLSMTAEERYQHLFAYKPELFNQVPLHYIASMLGMTPETLSRIRKKSIS